MGISAGILAAATVGTSVYSAEQQKKAQSRASDAQQQADLRARKIAAEQKPMEETATLGINTGDKASTLGSLGLLIEPDKKRPTSGLGTAGKSGVGATATAGLGFNV